MKRTGGTKQVERLRQELACPSCAYSLQGLHGDDVTCPECGTRCNILHLMMGGWRGPWQLVPGYTRLLVPVAWLLVTSLLAAVPIVADLATGRPLVATPIIVASIVTVWIVLLFRLHADMPNGRAIVLSLLAHALAILYMVGVVGIITLIVRLLTSAFAAGAVFQVLFCVPFAVILYGCRRGERYIAGRCIQRLLVEQSSAATMDA